MLPIHAYLARRAMRSRAGSALPHAPVVPREPVQRSRWQSG